MAPESEQPITTQLQSAPPRPPLPLPLQLAPHSHASTPPTLIAQGAEALLYRTTYLQPSLACALKYRPSKAYRHPTLDARLTRHRILSEARVLVRCARAGVVVPAVYHVDWEAGSLMMEWIEGRSVRDVLNEWFVEGGGEGGAADEVKGLMRRIGAAVAGMHAVGVVHGDLTTSNLMLRPVPAPSHSPSSHREALERPNAASSSAEKGTAATSLAGQVVVIDFGLAAQSLQDEDRAVDLYVLERAFGSTHPRAEGLFEEVLSAYRDSFRGARVVLKKLELVRLRGRKKSMIG